MINLYQLFIIWFLFFFSSLYAKSNELIINNKENAYSAAPYLYYFEDAKEIFDSSTITNQEFQPVNKKRVIFPGKNTPFWYKITLLNKSSDDQELVFEIAYENINRLEFYTYNDATKSLNLKYVTGNKTDYNNWPIQNRNNPIPYKLAKDDKKKFYIKVLYSREVQFPLTIRKQINYLTNELDERTVLGMYAGYFMMIIVLNLFFFYKFKQRIYIWFVLLCGIIGVSVLTFEGMHIPILAPYSTWLTINLDIFNCYFGMLGSYFFVCQFLELKKHTILIQKVLLVLLILTTAIVIIYFITGYHFVFVAEYIMAAFFFNLCLIAGIIIMFMGYKNATFFVISDFILGISIFNFVLSNYFLDVYKRISSEREMMVGSIIEITILSYALSYRMKQLNEDIQNTRIQVVNSIIMTDEVKDLIESKAKLEDMELKNKHISVKWELTSREVEVLEEIAKGATNNEIAKKLYISVNTVKYHIRNIFDKLNVSNRVEALYITNQA